MDGTKPAATVEFSASPALRRRLRQKFRRRPLWLVGYCRKSHINRQVLRSKQFSDAGKETGRVLKRDGGMRRKDSLCR
jgi:hypothetical protein